MPIYEIEAPDGRIFEVEGSVPPTEEELNEIFESMGAAQAEGPSSEDLEAESAFPGITSSSLYQGGEVWEPTPELTGEDVINRLVESHGMSPESAMMRTSLFPRSAKRAVQGEEGFLGAAVAGLGDLFSIPGRAAGQTEETPMYAYEQDQVGIGQGILRDPTLIPGIMVGSPGVAAAKTLGRKALAGAGTGFGMTAMSDVMRRSGLEEGAGPLEFGLSAAMGAGLTAVPAAISRATQSRRLAKALPDSPGSIGELLQDESLYRYTQRGMDEAAQAQAQQGYRKALSESMGEAESYWKEVPNLAQTSSKEFQRNVQPISDAIEEELASMVEDGMSLEAMSAARRKMINAIGSLAGTPRLRSNPNKADLLFIREILDSGDPNLIKAVARSRPKVLVGGRDADVGAIDLYRRVTPEGPSPIIPKEAGFAGLTSDVLGNIIFNPRANQIIYRGAPAAAAPVAKESEVDRRWREYMEERAQGWGLR